jgi:hypothetical protein
VLTVPLCSAPKGGKYISYNRAVYATPFQIPRRPTLHTTYTEARSNVYVLRTHIACDNRTRRGVRTPETSARPSRLTIPSTMRSRIVTARGTCKYVCSKYLTVPSITGSCNPGRDRTHAACTLQANTSTEPSNAQWPGNEVGARAASASDTCDRSRQLRGRTRTRARSAEGTEPALTVKPTRYHTRDKTVAPRTRL